MASINPQQVDIHFEVLNTSSHMKILKIRIADFSLENPDLMAKVVNKLETVEMRSSNLTSQQIVKILKQGLISTKLKELSLERNPGVTGSDEADELYNKAKKVIHKLLL